MTLIRQQLRLDLVLAAQLGRTLFAADTRPCTQCVCRLEHQMALEFGGEG